ncbi:MAG: sulfotransferase [Chitinophagales bacterium]|nr:sulfotransferase [Chitinophagales bacterium]
MKDRLPNFFIVGAPKAGTTSLYYYLKRHPEVFMSSLKEPNFFSYDETIKQNLYHKEKGVSELEDYKKLFAGANGQYKAVGEASVSYLFYPSVPGRIRQMVPDARIIMSLRNPVERAFSHYFMEHKLGYVNVSLEDIVFKRTGHKFAHLWYQQYVELGLYYEQVKRYLETFQPEQVCIFIYDELSENMHDSILRVFDFLNIDKSYMPELEGRYNTYSTPRNKLFHFLYAQKKLRTMARSLIPSGSVEAIKNLFLTRSKGGEKKQEIIEELKRIYKPDIKKLEGLLNKNLSIWYE